MEDQTFKDVIVVFAMLHCLALMLGLYGIWKAITRLSGVLQKTLDRIGSNDETITGGKLPAPHRTAGGIHKWV